MAQNEGIRVYALGVGPGTLKFELEQIASDPIDRHVFQVRSQFGGEVAL